MSTDKPLVYESSSLFKFTISSTLSILAGAGLMYLFRPAAQTGLQFALAIPQSLKYCAAMVAYAIDAGPAAALKALIVQPFGFILGAIVIIGFGGTFGLLAIKEFTRNNTQGESTFAKLKHIRKMKLLEKQPGKILGTFEGKVMRAPATRHALFIAPTRVGKTRQIISSILTYPGSVIVIDSKRQIVDICRAARASRGPTHEINWTDPRSPDGYNPFALATIPSSALEREKQAERFASQFVKLEKASEKGGAGQHFNETAWRNIAAFALYEIYEALRTSKDGHPAAVVQRFVEMATKEEENESDEDQGGAFAALENMQAHARQHGFPVRIVEDIGLLKMTHYEERQSHISTLVTKLQLLRSLSLRESLGKSTFRLEDFRKRPTSLFIGFPQSDADTYGKITALFLEALFSYLLDHPQQGDDLPILLVMDEFRDIPPIPNFVNLMTKGAGAGIDVNIMIQDLVQLRNIYKDQAKEIRNNCEYIFVYQSPDAETQKELSGLVGMETVKNKSRTTGRDILTSVTTSEQGRFLIRPEQWGIIPFGKHVLLVRGHFVRPILADCVFWDEHKAIRALVPPEMRHAT